MTKRARDAATAADDERPAKRARQQQQLRVLSLEGVFDPLPPRCSCAAADVRRSDQGGWVCIACGQILGIDDAIDDDSPAFFSRAAPAAAARSSAKPFDIEGSARLAATASKIDGSSAEKRHKVARKALAEMAKDLGMASNQAVLTKALGYLQSYMVDCAVGEQHRKRITLFKIALLCLQRAAAEHRIAFDVALIRRVLQEQNDTKVHADDKLTLSRLRSDIESKLQLPAIGWATSAHGFATRIAAGAAKMDIKEQMAAGRLIDWFAAQPASQKLKEAAAKPGQRGVKKAHSIRDTASNLLAKLPAEEPAAAAAATDTDKGVGAAAFAFLACWLVCDRVAVPVSVSASALAHLKRVFLAYALVQFAS